ncbi:MAG: hypothetical protein ABI211_19640 [Vicinamibacterales bacterium]
MRRSVVTTTAAIMLALAPAAFAQTPPAQPPAGQPPAETAPAAPAAPKEPRMALTGASGAFMFVIKADQTANFEELVGKVKAAMTSSENPVRKQQAAGYRVFKAAEPSGANALYLCLVDPAIPAAEYDPLVILSESLGQSAGTPENQEMLKKYAGVFANVSRLNLTPVAK